MTAKEIALLEQDLRNAQIKSHAAMDRRRALPPGSTRARVTTANANWARAAEQRDRCAERLATAIAQFSNAKENNMTTAETITDEQIHALESESEQAGDRSMARDCRDALALLRQRRQGMTEWGASVPREISACVDAINAARARDGGLK